MRFEHVTFLFQQGELQNDRIVTAAWYTKCKGKFTAIAQASATKGRNSDEARSD